MKKYFLSLVIAAMLASCNSDTKSNSINTTAPVTTTASKEVKDSSPPKVMTAATLDLTQYGVANNPNNVLGGLKVGDLAPNFIAKSNRGRMFNLEEELGRTPIILTFFRGGWCGYCTKHLAEFKDNLKEIQNLDNARVVAVTPQKMEYAAEVANDEGLTYNLLPDDNHEIMKKYKVFFHTTSAYNDKIMKFKGKDLSEFNDDTAPVLPVPATYVIGKDMRVKYVFYDPDYSKRPPMEELIAALQ